MDAIIVLGDPTRSPEILYENVPEHAWEYLERLGDVDDTGDEDEQDLVEVLIEKARLNTVLYVGSNWSPSPTERRVLSDVLDRYPEFVIDEALEIVRAQIGGDVTNPAEFEDVYYDAVSESGQDKLVFEPHEDPDTLAFHAPNRKGSLHTIRFAPDGTHEIDGCVMRCAAIYGLGSVKSEVLGSGVLKPTEVLAFVARRLATNGVEDLLGYGRAFGPGKEDHTNATLGVRTRQFRSTGIVGVVLATPVRVSKAKPEMVNKVAIRLRELYPQEPLLLHQQCREIYFGQPAMDAFRARVWCDIRTQTMYIELPAKSSKHARVDHPYCLYTASGTGFVRIPCVIGMFEESNDGMVYGPQALLDEVGGYLKETVRAVKDFKQMPDDLIAGYYATNVLVAEGDRIMPGAVVFEIGDEARTWDTKADYGIVRRVVDTAHSDLVEIRIEIDAWFMGEAKFRGPFKAMASTLEGAGITCTVEGDRTPRFVVGGPGTIKDSAAANAYLHDVTEVTASVTSRYCDRDYARAKQRHAPLEELGDGLWLREYPKLDVTLIFSDDLSEVTTIDRHALTCDVDVMIEASPVAQSVGNSALTLPQMCWLSHLSAGNRWVQDEILPGILERVRALAYMHTVAAELARATLIQEEVTA